MQFSDVYPSNIQEGTFEGSKDAPTKKSSCFSITFAKWLSSLTFFVCTRNIPQKMCCCLPKPTMPSLTL